MSKSFQSSTIPRHSKIRSSRTDMASSSSSLLWKQPITWLSAMWFGLCASLVHKYNDLIGIFISFLASFGLAWCYQHILFPKSDPIQSTASSSTAATTKSKNSPTQSMESTTKISKLKKNKSYAPYSDESKNVHGNIKDMVGLTICLISFFLMYHPPPHGILSYSEFYVLTISTGYLAFALWYSALFCRPIPPPILSILEDCVTLTILLVYLTLYQTSLSKFHMWIQSWIIYKTIALLLSFTTRYFMSSGRQRSSSPKSTVWTIHGVDYDLTDFVHPGGSEALELGRGRDCSALFESYHPFTQRHRHVLKKYQMNSQQIPKTSQDPFYECLKERVAETLLAHGIRPETHRTAPPLRVAYYCIVFVGLIISAYYHAKASLIGSFLFGIFGWLIGALGHDGGHFAVSRHSWINDWAVWGMSLLCNPIMWQHQHTFAHHSHTNEFDHDPDLHHFHLFLRVHRNVRQQPYYQNQRLWPYVMVAYMFVVFGTCVWIPLDVIQTGFLYGIVECTDRNRPWRALAMILHFMTYIGFVIILPLMTASSISWGILCVLVHMATSGWLFGIFSQINHISGECLNADAITRQQQQQQRRNDDDDDTNHSNINTLRIHSWAAAQVETSNNFAPQSWVWHILSNGLNLQIEHHLFPSVNHSHLPIIAPIVEKTCHEYGIQYKCFRSWSEVMQSTLTWLDQLAPEEYH